MTIKVYENLEQGSPEWLELRGTGTWNASEAPIIMGVHPKVSREEFMHAQVTMTPREFSSYVENVVFEEGHDTEHEARKIMSKRMRKDFLRVTVTNDDSGEYTLLSSLDGADMDLEDYMEHKQWSEVLVAYITQHGEPPPLIHWQLEHQLLTVPSLEKALLVISDGTEKDMIVFEYRRVPGRAERLIAGWKLYQEDKAKYKPKFKDAKVVVAKKLVTLKLPDINIHGEVVREGDIEGYKKDFIASVEALNKDLKTDADFAGAKADLDYLEDLRKRLKLARDKSLDEVMPLRELFNTIDELDELAKVTGQNLESQITTRKNNRKLEIANEANNKIKDALDEAHKEFTKHEVDFRGKIYTKTYDPFLSMKNLRSFDSMANKVETATVDILLDIGEKRNRVRTNLEKLHAAWKGFEFLFRDLNELVALETGVLEMTVRDRINTHKAKLAETDATRIRKHQDTLTRIDALVATLEGQPVELLRLAKRQLEAMDILGLEEFKAEGQKKHDAALLAVASAIEKAEAAEKAAQQKKDDETRVEVERQLERNRQAEELQRSAVLAAQEESQPPIDIMAEAGFTDTMPLDEALRTHQPATIDGGTRFVKLEPFTESPTLEISIGRAGDGRDIEPTATLVIDDETPLTADLNDDYMDGASDGGAHAGELPQPVVTSRGGHFYPGRTTQVGRPAPTGTLVDAEFIDTSDRPSNDKIIGLLMATYAEDRETVIEWLRDVVRTV